MLPAKQLCTTTQKVWLMDRRWTKLSLCAAILSRRHKTISEIYANELYPYPGFAGCWYLCCWVWWWLPRGGLISAEVPHWWSLGLECCCFVFGLENRLLWTGCPHSSWIFVAKDNKIITIFKFVGTYNCRMKSVKVFLSIEVSIENKEEGIHERNWLKLIHKTYFK